MKTEKVKNVYCFIFVTRHRAASVGAKNWVKSTMVTKFTRASNASAG